MIDFPVTWRRNMPLNEYNIEDRKEKHQSNCWIFANYSRNQIKIDFTKNPPVQFSARYLSHFNSKNGWKHVKAFYAKIHQLFRFYFMIACDIIFVLLKIFACTLFSIQLYNSSLLYVIVHNLKDSILCQCTRQNNILHKYITNNVA